MDSITPKKIMRLSDIHAEWRTITEETLKPKRHFIKFYDQG